MAKSRKKTKRNKTSGNKAGVLSSRVVYRGPAFIVTADQVLEPSGVRARRDIVHHSGSVVILAVEEADPSPTFYWSVSIAMPPSKVLWELPAGRIDDGEKGLAAAKRELLEETGYTASRWKRILRFYASPGFLAETMESTQPMGSAAAKRSPRRTRSSAFKWCHFPRPLTWS